MWILLCQGARVLPDIPMYPNPLLSTWELLYNEIKKTSRSQMSSSARDDTLTGISVAYANQLKPPIKLSRRARGAARRNMRNDGEPIKPFGMSSTRRRIRPSDPKQNNPNDIGAVIIPQGQGQM